MRMAILDLIEYPNERGDEIVHRIPESGSGEFRLGSQLVVRESQRAVFFRDGKALDVFGPGRHTISTNNIPLLTGLLGLPFGGDSPFRAEVYFVSMREFTDMKWGSQQPLAYRDTELGMVRLRAFGTYSMKVADPQVFVNEIVGTRGS
jgi:membrane protease subunit (stomatin/prohibitin family)